jgi:hypothetical protein
MAFNNQPCWEEEPIESYTISESKYNPKLDENIQVGDIIKYHLKGSYYKIVEVVKTTQKSIMFKECGVSIEKIDTFRGDTIIYATYLWIDIYTKGFRKKKVGNIYNVFDWATGSPKCLVSEPDISF